MLESFYIDNNLGSKITAELGNIPLGQTQSWSCRSLNEGNGLYKLIHANAWSPVGRTVLKG